MGHGGHYRRGMDGLFALSLFAAQLGGNIDPSLPGSSPTRAVVPARAFVRILPGAKVSLSSDIQPEGYKVNPATITLEDGSLRPAKLVEFQ